MTTTGRLSRSRHDRVITGVCGGIGRHLGIDPVWLRVAFVLLVLAGGSGVLLYIVVSLVIPSEERRDAEAADTVRDGAQELGDRAREMVGGLRSGGRDTRLLAGILVAFGAFLLLRQLDAFRWVDAGLLGPVLLIALGVWLLMHRRA